MSRKQSVHQPPLDLWPPINSPAISLSEIPRLQGGSVVFCELEDEALQDARQTPLPDFMNSLSQKAARDSFRLFCIIRQILDLQFKTFLLSLSDSDFLVSISHP